MECGLFSEGALLEIGDLYLTRRTYEEVEPIAAALLEYFPARIRSAPSDRRTATSDQVWPI